MQNSLTWSSSCAIRFGENTRDATLRCMVWRGGSSNRRTPGGDPDAGLDDVEDVATGIREGLPVEERLLDVLMARQGPEVVALVVVDRRLLRSRW